MNLKTYFQEKVQPFLVRNRLFLGGGTAIIVIFSAWGYLQGCKNNRPEVVVTPETKDSVVAIIIQPPSITLTDGSVDIEKATESHAADVKKVTEDLKKDIIAESPCDSILRVYGMIINEMLATNYSKTSMDKYRGFGRIMDENGIERMGPKMAACQQDSLFRKAFDDLDRKMTNGN
jgi:hypothetical protein